MCVSIRRWRKTWPWLCTNSLQTQSNTALSDNAGVVRIVWRIRQESSGPIFSFSWVESGGPPVVKPERDGFGQTLLRRLVGSTIGSDPVAEYAPEGFRYSFECPLERVIGASVALKSA